MFDLMTTALKNSLIGKHIHVEPMTALKGLTHEMASAVPENSEHSCWHILYHTVFWQDLMLEALRGKKDVNWPKTNEPSWPQELPKDGKKWDKLVQRFKEGLDEAYKIADNVESLDDLPAWPKVPLFQALMVFGQHNAYHIGEIVATRQALGFWPPSQEH